MLRNICETALAPALTYVTAALMFLYPGIKTPQSVKLICPEDVGKLQVAALPLTVTKTLTLETPSIKDKQTSPYLWRGLG